MKLWILTYSPSKDSTMDIEIDKHLLSRTTKSQISAPEVMIPHRN